MEDNLREAERRIEEARRTRATKLDLGDLALSELPESLGGLGELRALYLGKQGLDSRGEVDWSPVRDAATFSDLSPLTGLRSLQSLDLSLCGNVSDLSPLSGIQGLLSLDLSVTRVSDLSPLSGLQHLQSIGLSGARVSDLSPLSGLQSLHSLDLMETGVSDLVPLSGLRGLQILYLPGCKEVRDLSPLLALVNLVDLDIYGCGTNISKALVQTLADRKALEKLVVDAVVGVPRETLSRDVFDNCLPRLRAYLYELQLGVELESDVKLILLGNGRVGKTQLCRRFRNEPFEEGGSPTHGVQLWRKPLTLKAGGEEQTFQVNWWDFGGQDIYHGTHALFLRSRAVFLILWTPHLENREEYYENGIPLRNQPLAYWLEYVRTLAGPGSAVIVVQSQCDRLSDIQPRQVETEGFGFIQSCYYSAKSEEEHGRENLEALLKGAIGYLRERSGTLQIGAGRFRLREELYRRHQEDQARDAEDRRNRTLSLEEFQALCEEAGGIVSWEHALDYLHQTGVVFYDRNLFSNAIVLDQTWALDAIYAVFHRSQAAPWLRDSGRFTREDLTSLVWQDRSTEEQNLFLRLMQSCGVCFPVGETPRGETRFVAPDLLPPFETVRLPAWKEKPDLPTLRMEYRFFHQAVIRGLMREIGGRAEDLAEYWKYGFWFQDGKRDTQILLQFKDTNTDREPGAGALVVQAQGEDPLGLLREIRRATLRQRIGEKPEERLTLNGVTVERKALESQMEGKVLDLHGTPVPVALFAAFFAEREDEYLEARKGLDVSTLDIHPRPLNENDKPRPEVYISYAWGDDSPEGKLRSQAVDELYTALEKEGFGPVRDRDAMKSGDQISAFIRQLTRADLVVAVISDRYLRSPFCLFEIYKLWQRSQADPAVMDRCLVPVILPEVRIGEVGARVPYMEHWSEQAESLEAVVRNPKLKPGPKTWEEVRLRRQFAEHVDDIMVFLNDVLMPRNLEVHLDNGFAAVRDALRSRVAARATGPAAAATRRSS